MPRFLYRLLLRLHPARFREHFAEEMLWIFDQTAEKPEAARLLADGFLSLVRQWALRTQQFEDPAIGHTALSADGGPLFYTFDSFKPRTSALIDGGILSIALFIALCLTLRYNWSQPVFVGLPSVRFETGAEVEPSESVLRLPTANAIRARTERRATSRHPEDGEKPTRRLPAVSEPSPTPVQSGSTETSENSHATSPTTKLTVPESAAYAIASVPTAMPRPTPSLETIESYAGTYISDPPTKLMILVTVVDGQLTIQLDGEPQITVVPVSETRFAPPKASSGWVQFSNDESRIDCRLRFYLNGRHFTAHRKTN